jgi:hypothetical protein
MLPLRRGLQCLVTPSNIGATFVANAERIYSSSIY